MAVRWDDGEGKAGHLSTSALVRWVKFNAVGAVGMGVQLGVLAGLNRMMPGHYLAATAVAVEVTLLHNFAWHVRYTWRDRSDEGGMLGRLVRFHLSNGAVSMAGNLALMPVLVQGARMPVVAANAVAVLACSVVNFLLGDGWVFQEQRSAFGVQKESGRPYWESTHADPPIRTRLRRSQSWISRRPGI